MIDVTTPLPIRRQILEAIEERFNGVDATSPTPVGTRNPTGDPIGIDFTLVKIGPLPLQANSKKNSIGIVAGNELPNYNMYPVIKGAWNVSIECRSPVNVDDLEPALIGERSLAAMQRIVAMDGTWGGLASDTTEVGSEIDLIAFSSTSVMVVLHLRIDYFRSQFDPRIAIQAD